MSRKSVTEAELHAFLDGALPDEQRREVEAYLEDRPDEAARLEAYRRQQAALHARYDPVIEEPVPERLGSVLKPRFLPWSRVAAAAAWLAIGVSTGWYVRGPDRVVTYPTRVSAPAFVRDAALAHAVYSPEIRHPVEVGADDESHLVAWLSKRMGAEIRPRDFPISVTS